MATRWIALTALVLLVGCETNVATTGSGGGDQASAGPPPPPGAAPVKQVAVAETKSQPATITLPSGQKVQPTIEVESGSELGLAQKGVAQKGRSLDEYEGMIVTPIKSLFAVQERVIFEIQIPQAMSIYKATNGQAPQSHEEFMEKVVKFNQLQLPDLPPGHRYRYDPGIEQLLVEQPKKKAE